MEGEKKNFRSTSSPSTSGSASGDPERDPERARLLLLYEGLYKSVIQDVRAEAELLLKKKLNFQTVSGLFQQRVPKVGTYYEIISDMKIELGPDHPLVHGKKAGGNKRSESKASSSGGLSSWSLTHGSVISSSSTESLGTYRNVIEADNEAQIYQRIQALQAREYYNIPLQNEVGEYETIVREHFDQALNPNLESIFELSPYTEIRKEAYEFLQDKVEPFSDPSFADQRALMSANLNSFIEQLNEHGRNSQIYQEFYRHFTDEDFRRSLVKAVKSAIGLAIFVITFRVQGTIAIESINSIQATLPNAISSHRTRLQDDLLTGFHFSVSERFVPWSTLKASIVELIREGLTVLRMVRVGGPKSHMSILLLQPYFLMSKTRNYAKIIIGSWLFLTAMAIHLSLWVAPLDFQQGGNSRILYVHVPVARMIILVYIVTTINTFLFLLTKHPLFLHSSGTSKKMGAFSMLFTLVTEGFRGRPMWGTFWVWDTRLTSVFISFLIYLGALCFQKLPVELAPIPIRTGPIDIPIIKFSVNWWNTSHQPGSISRSGTSIHVPMLIPILSNFANFLFSTRIFFVLETRLPIPSFLESPLMEEIEAQEGILKPSSLAESFCIHGGSEEEFLLHKIRTVRLTLALEVPLWCGYEIARPALEPSPRK
ncbi:putative cytochrome c biosynthesis ccmC-like mitochondrial protein, partial [Bienertia sinuspersici]